MPLLINSGLFEGGRSASSKNTDDPCSETLREETYPENEILEEDDDDDELVVGSTVESFNCPLTLRPILNPLRSNICNHVFSREGLTDYFSHASLNVASHPRGKNVKPCPATACSYKQSIDDFSPDPGFARRVKAWVRRQDERNQKKKKGSDDVVLDSDENLSSDDDERPVAVKSENK